MLQVWGRTNSVNVQKVLWACDELGLEYQRIDAGMQYGRTRDADFLAMNPNGQVPTLVDGDFVLWESNSILRYLAMAYGRETDLYPDAPRLRAGLERWLDWTLSRLQPAESPVFRALVRTPPAERNMAAIQTAADAAAAVWRVLDQHLDGRSYCAAEHFTIADIALGAYARRWFGVEGIVKPDLPHLRRWFEQLEIREGFQRHVAPPLT